MNSFFDRLALILVIIGALNWGLIGLFRFDLVASLFGGQASPLSRIIYFLVGIAGLYSIIFLFRDVKTEEGIER
ncbi:MAG: DUF378 domain-containing protein [Clostridia bacterium]|nr:DUF378 domain-containing protein [Clostridia bacterium]